MATTKPDTHPPTASNAVTSAQTGGALALPTGVLAALAEEAKEIAAKERPSVSKISLRGGILSYGGVPVAGNALEALVLVAAYRNAFYANRFDPNNIQNPTCFALSESDEAMAPHENVTEPENATCKGCKRNEWGSGSDLPGATKTRGKACKETRRLVLMPATVMDGEDGVKKVQAAELAIVDLPVTSVRHYSQFVNTLAATASVPPWAAVCKISVHQDPKTQFRVEFQALRIIPTEPLLMAVKARREDAMRIALTPWDESKSESPDPDAGAKAGVATKSAKY